MGTFRCLWLPTEHACRLFRIASALAGYSNDGVFLAYQYIIPSKYSNLESSYEENEEKEASARSEARDNRKLLLLYVQIGEPWRLLLVRIRESQSTGVWSTPINNNNLDLHFRSKLQHIMGLLLCCDTLPGT